MNENITAPQVRLVYEGGSNIVETRFALRQAQADGLDLVVLNPNVNPPVCKICDAGKIKYENSKKHKHVHTQKTKEIQLKPAIAEHDLMIKIKHANEFLNKNDKVRFSMVFKGRSIVNKDSGFDIMNKIIQHLTDIGEEDQKLSLNGSTMTMTLKKKK